MKPNIYTDELLAAKKMEDIKMLVRWDVVVLWAIGLILTGLFWAWVLSQFTL
jgi:hypothetical protein